MLVWLENDRYFYSVFPDKKCNECCLCSACKSSYEFLGSLLEFITTNNT